MSASRKSYRNSLKKRKRCKRKCVVILIGNHFPYHHELTNIEIIVTHRLKNKTEKNEYHKKYILTTPISKKETLCRLLFKSPMKSEL